VVKPTTICGEVTLQAARETGLREGTPVIVGTSDTAAEDYGAGAIEPGQGIIKMATAGNVCIMSDRPRPTPAGFNYPHVVEGLWYIVAGTNSCASANRWYRDALCRWEVEKAKSKGESAFRRMDEMAAKAPLGAEGLFFHPYLMGERSPYFDPYLRASFVGATMGHQKEHFSRAVLEGVAYSLLDASRVIKDLGQEVRDLRLIGGGAKSPLWRQILADVMGMPVLIPSAGDASFGSALLAGVGIGLFADPQTAVRQGVQYDALVQPNRQNHEKYQKYFSIYQKIHDQLASINRTIHESLAER
jgi:xylulokinase